MEGTEEEVRKIDIKTKEENDIKGKWEEENLQCTNENHEERRNGMIIYKRGKKELKPGQVEPPAYTMTNNKSVNNVVFKKLKIALALNSDEILTILQLAGVTLSKGELSAVFRKEGHSNYKPCGDRYVRNFLKGLAIQNRAL